VSDCVEPKDRIKSPAGLSDMYTLNETLFIDDLKAKRTVETFEISDRKFGLNSL
jgi:hypothetical protein